MHEIDGVEVRYDRTDSYGKPSEVSHAPFDFEPDPELFKEARDKNEKHHETEPGTRIYYSSLIIDGHLEAAGIPPMYETVEMDSLERVEKNQSAFAAAETYLNDAPNLIKVGRGMLFSGPVGSGKTALAIAILKAITRRYTAIPRYKHVVEVKLMGHDGFVDQHCSCVLAGDQSGVGYVVPRYISARDLIENIHKQINNKQPTDIQAAIGATQHNWAYPQSLGRLLRAARGAGHGRLLITVIDDLGADSLTEWGASLLSATVDLFYTNRLPLIVTTNLDEENLKKAIGDRPTDRLVEMCQWRAITCESWRRKAHSF